MQLWRSGKGRPLINHFYSVIWNYSLIVMVKTFHCYSWTIYWYSWLLALFDEKCIILWPGILDSSSYENMMTQSTFIMETKKHTTPNTYFNWTNNTSILHTVNLLPMNVWCKLKKICIIIDYILVACEKVQLIKWNHLC